MDSQLVPSAIRNMGLALNPDFLVTYTTKSMTLAFSPVPRSPGSLLFPAILDTEAQPRDT